VVDRTDIILLELGVGPHPQYAAVRNLYPDVGNG
jgi:hypothetical protein